MNKRQQSGFTLVELIVTLSVAAITATMAVPAFSDFIYNNRLVTQANNFLSSLQLARSEAVKRNITITVCKSSNGSSCATNGNWQQGWIVFVDNNTNATTDSGEQVLWVQEPISSSLALDGQSSVANYIAYRASGAAQLINGDAQTGNLVLCDTRGLTSHSKAISISATGRPRISAAKDIGITSCTI